MNNREVIYIAVGERARAEQAKSLEGLLQVWSGNIRTICGPANMTTDKQSSRWLKLSLDQRCNAAMTLYLDADTRIRQDVSAGFDILADGWDLVLAPSQHQGDECMWHVKEDERAATLEELEYTPLQLQAGVMFVQWNERTYNLFKNWRREWLRYQDEDQAALLRALSYSPVKIWLLGRPWNGGAIVEHHCGALRR